MYEVLNTLLLAGAIQGIIFSLFAFFSPKFRSRSSFYLGLLILVFSLNLLQYYISLTILDNFGDLFSYFYTPFSSLFLVLYYFYVKTFLYPKAKIRKWEYLLYLPFIIAFVGALIEKIGYRVGYGSSVSFNMFFNHFRFVQETFNLVLSVILCIVAYRMIRHYDREYLYVHPTSEPKKDTQWLQAVSLALLAMCLFWILPLYYEVTFQAERSLPLFYVLWMGLAGIIYLLGHLGLYRYGIIKEREKIQTVMKTVPLSMDYRIQHNQSKDLKSEVIKTFEKHVFTEKKFLDNTLSLETIADELGVNSSYLSRLINEELDTGFSNYINRLRVEEAKVCLTNPEFKNYNLVSIGLEAGFNSKSAFYSAFKKFTGKTPSEYKNEKAGHN